MTAAKQNSTIAVKPTQRAYGITSRSQLLDANRMMAVVMQMQPTNIQISANSHSGCNSGVKHTCGRLYNVMHVHIKPNRVSPENEKKKNPIHSLKNHFATLESCSIANIHAFNVPPTSVTIQSGVAKLMIANTSAAMKNDALIVVNRSIISCPCAYLAKLNVFVVFCFFFRF